MGCHGQISCLGAGRLAGRERGREAEGQGQGHLQLLQPAVSCSSSSLPPLPPRLSAHSHTLASKPPCDACVGDIALQELGFAVKENVLFSRCDLDSLPDSPLLLRGKVNISQLQGEIEFNTFLCDKPYN